MKQISLDDGRLATISETYQDRTRWNGSNEISLATGSEFVRERLHHTASGRWVMCSTSQYEGTAPTAEEIDAEAAARWLIRNHYVEEARALLPDEVDSLTI